MKIELLRKGEEWSSWNVARGSKVLKPRHTLYSLYNASPHRGGLNGEGDVYFARSIRVSSLYNKRRVDAASNLYRSTETMLLCSAYKR